MCLYSHVKTINCLRLLILVTAFLVASGHPSASLASADRIFINGYIYTMDKQRPQAEAIATSKNLIIDVGGAKDILSHKGPDTEVIDLKGQTMLPGFHDLHVHPLFAGSGAISCVIPEGQDLAKTLQIIKSCAAKTPEGQWVSGRQWDVNALGTVPHKSMIDKIVEDTPVFLQDTSGHSAWVNSKALSLAGISKNTHSPKGGIIERDASGAPTGVLRESAIDMVTKVAPPPNDKTIDSAMLWSFHQMLSYGITSFSEASLGFVAGAKAELKAYANLADSGLLKQRARICITWEPGVKCIESQIALRNLYVRERVSPDCIKIHLDGVPTDSHTAAMLASYAGRVHGRNDKASKSGRLLFNPEVLNQALIDFDRMGLAVKFHAAGDAAVRASLDAIEAARKANSFSGVLHDVGHCTFVSEDDIPRALQIGATFEVSPYLWSPSPINNDITNAIGDSRMERVWPIRDMIDSGALVVAGSDWSVVPSVNPWIGIEALVTRERPGGSKDSFGKQHAVRLDEALELFTVNAAKHEGTANKLGVIQTGMLADLVIIDKNPFDIPVNKLHKIQVTQTIIDGEVVYRNNTE